MNKTLMCVLAATAVLFATAMPHVCQAADAAAGRVDVFFEYQRQSGSGSNQFAVWVENAAGSVVKTLFVTNFTAGRGGWEYRKQSLPQWVAAADIANMSSDKVDAVSRATPAPGTVTVSWDCRGEDGAPVPAGEYVVILEATLRGENGVLYRSVVDVGGAAQTVAPEPRYAGSGEAERGMIRDVRVGYIR